MKKILVLILTISSFLAANNIQLMHASSVGEVSVSMNDKTFLKSVNYLENTGLIPFDRGATLGVSPINSNNTVEFSLDDLGHGDHIISAVGPSYNSREVKLVSSNIRTFSNSREHFALKILNGFVNEPSVDVFIEDNLVFENLNYGEYSNYIQLEIGFQNISLVDHYSGYELGRYAVNLNDRGNETGVLVISGKFDRAFANLKLINPTGSVISVFEVNLEVSSGDDNQNEESRDITETAQVQIVHNSPYPVVDVYVDGALALEDVPYRASTGLVDLPVNTEVGIAPADGDVIATFPFELAENGTYVVVASGIVGDNAHPFNLLASTLATAAEDNDHFALKVMHGVTDAPAVDIYADGNLLVENLAYGEFQGYLQVPVGDYTLDITGHGSTDPVASFSAPLSSFGGGSGVVYASGFLAPAETDSAFALVLTTPNGDVITLPATETALSVNNDNFVNISKDYIIHQNYPNPFNPTTSIQYELLTDSKLNITIFDMLGNVVDELYDGFQTSGNKSIKWDARNSSGELVSAGIYFYKIQVGNSSQVKRMIFLK
tara:strand:- start:998 stop:2644 length:1647 start_codon:yes stop_codon:yes gene_type:complete